MTIKYTRDDVREFARVVFRGWKELYKAQNNPADANKQRKRKKKIVRSQRSKQASMFFTHLFMSIISSESGCTDYYFSVETGSP